GKLGAGYLDALSFGLIVRQPAPSYFRLGKDHGRDGPVVEHRRQTGQHLGGDKALTHGSVGEHRLSRYVAYGQDALVCCTALLIYNYKTLLVDLDFGVFQSDVVAQRTAPDSRENARELGCLRSVLALERGNDAVFFFLQRRDLGVQ